MYWAKAGITKVIAVAAMSNRLRNIFDLQIVEYTVFGPLALI